jgi:hypothetical protein
MVAKTQDAEFSLSPLFIAIGVSLLTAILTVYLLPIDIVKSETSSSLTVHIGKVFPGTLVASMGSFDPARSGLTWAVQWIMAAVYLVIYFYIGPPWTTAYRAAVEKNCAELTRRGKGFGTMFFGLAILAGLILSDLGIVHFISFTRGTIFAGPINEVPYILRTQFLSRVGLAFYAWIIPLCTATYYWFFVAIVVNFRRYWRVGLR